jgi:hypothetical protein
MKSALKTAAPIIEHIEHDAAAIDRNHLDALETIANWSADLSDRIRRARLKFELIGLDETEQEALAAEQEQFKRCSKALQWRGE